jgi:S-adenosylmethionine hydrolase
MVQGEIVRIDRFGNLVTNIFRERLGQLGRSHGDADLWVEIEGRSINGIHTCYEDEPPGTLLALWGSTGALEVSINQGNAAATLGAQRHTVVRVSASRQV